MKNIKKYLGALLTLALIFTLVIQPPAAKAEESLPSNIEVISNNDQELKIKTTIDGVVGIMTQDKETLKISLETYQTNLPIAIPLLQNSLNNSDSSPSLNDVENDGQNILTNNYDISINEVSEDAGTQNINATYTDKTTNEKYIADPEAPTTYLVWLLPIGVVIGQVLLDHLLAMATAVLIGSITWVVAEEIASGLRNKQHDHYAARIMQNQVWIGPTISFEVAKQRLVSFNGDSDAAGNDVFSRSLSLAVKVAQSAGGGKEPVGPEIHGTLGFGYLYHYHTWNRVGGHSFF